MAAAAVAAAAVLAGCATVPTVGEPHAVRGTSGLGESYVQPIPPAPQTGWNQQDIVQGFLAASASPARDYAAAKKFLAPGLRARWTPGLAVTVLGGGSSLSTTHPGPQNIEGETTQLSTVTLTGHQLATISKSGQYIDSPSPLRYPFRLEKFGTNWLITHLPSASLLLTQSDFEQAYQPRNLYFWSPSRTALVPEAAFVPQQDAATTVATLLVEGLFQTNSTQPSSWLGSAVNTSFPAGTTVLGGSVTISGSGATVNLGGAAAKATPTQLANMAGQIVTTLTSDSYNQQAIVPSVVLEVNGTVRAIDGHELLQPHQFRNLVPGSQPPAATLYFTDPDDRVSELTPQASSPRPIAGPAGRGNLAFSAIAVSPDRVDPMLAGAVSSRMGCVIYYGPVNSSAPLGRSAMPGPDSGACSSLSWDAQGDIWTVYGQNVWVLQPVQREPITVALPPLPGNNQPPAYKVLALKVAPDGVRVAMLVQLPDGSRQVILTPIVRSSDGPQLVFGASTTIGATLTDPSAISWYDPDHLVVLEGAQLYSVPASGGPAAPVGTVPPGTATITSASPGQVATEAGDEILASSGGGPGQQPTGVRGTDPAYPG
jgi:lipoprotein LpqB-like beta-propeller protein/sporulation and spore germination protein